MLTVASGYSTYKNTAFWWERRRLDNLVVGAIDSCSNTDARLGCALYRHLESMAVINSSHH